jgi:anti-sigma28 factor (negative regulator of flagellin synthesis)
MTRRFRIDGGEYAVDALSVEGRTIVEKMTAVRLKLQELNNQQAILSKAKNAYIADLKSEIVQGRTGVDLGALFSDD